MSETEGAHTEEYDIGSLSLAEPPITEGPARRVERTRATLAFCLLGLIAAVTGVLLGLLAAGTLTSQVFAGTATVVLGPLFTLLGAATGYDYGKADR